MVGKENPILKHILACFNAFYSFDMFKGSQTKEDKSGFLGTMGITAIVGIVGGIFLILMVVFVIVYCLVKKKQKSFNSQQASVFGSRPVSIENGSLAVS